MDNKHIYTVSQITQEIGVIFENTFGMGIWVEGEISNFKAAASGHFTFTEDEKAALSAAMFSRANKDIKFKIEDGIKGFVSEGLTFTASRAVSVNCREN